MEFSPAQLPLAFSPETAESQWQVWHQSMAGSGRVQSDAGSTRALFEALTGNSPYLARLIRRMPDFFARIVDEEPGALLNEILEATSRAGCRGPEEATLMRELREAKARLALLVAAADIAGVWSLEQVTAALSDFAEAAIDAAGRWFVGRAAERGELDRAALNGEGRDIQEGSGLIVLGLGKLGGRELNYSSDIDLIILYDEERIPYCGSKDVQGFAVRFARTLVRILEKPTAEGYVFRTDLRLRPDPGATPLALSVGAAETYYQSIALNWERAAMIKARPVGGDREAGRRYLALLSPFVWRRSLDFAAIEDIHAIRDQIIRHYDQAGRSLEGYDVKLGEGGIREIEFFAQLQQLAHGGRDPRLRVRPTLEALDRLVESGRLEAEVRNELAAAYRYLRTLEHRLQMVEDQQTHRLPEHRAELARIAVFMGYGKTDESRSTTGSADRQAAIEALERDLHHHSERVKRHYDALLPASDGSARLDERRIVELAERLGLPDPPRIAAMAENWHHGRYRALRSDRARRLLGRLLPSLLEAFGEADEPDQALARFDTFLRALPAGVQFLALLEAHPRLLNLLVRILTLAPPLSDMLARHPQRIDALLEADFFAPLPDRTTMIEQAHVALAGAPHYEAILDRIRVFAAEIRFRIGVHVLEGLSSPAEAGRALSTLADAAILALLPHVRRRHGQRYGDFPGAELLVLALGKYGGEELTFRSDLDIVLLYDRGANAPETSTGPRRVAAPHYFSALGQSLITALTTMTAEGPLFEVDTRLRPSGRAGPLVVAVETFREYHRREAWTWEHMALTRARLVVGHPRAGQQIRRHIEEILTRHRAPEELLPAVATMRERIARSFPADRPWDVKYARGGVVDLEFVVQYLLLREGARIGHALITPHLDDAIRRLGDARALTGTQARLLLDAHRFYQALMMMMRLSLAERPASADDIPAGVQRLLVARNGFDDFAALEERLLACERSVHHIFDQIVAGPAAKLADKTTPEGREDPATPQ